MMIGSIEPEVMKIIDESAIIRGVTLSLWKRTEEKKMTETVKQLNKILENAVMSDQLKEAVKESILALEEGGIELAFELTAVKSLICGEGADPETYHFREDTQQNKDTLGRSVYGLLDSIHHDLAIELGKIPSGRMILSANGMREKAESEMQHPIITRIQEERAAIRERARRTAEKDPS